MRKPTNTRSPKPAAGSTSRIAETTPLKAVGTSDAAPVRVVFEEIKKFRESELATKMKELSEIVSLIGEVFRPVLKDEQEKETDGYGASFIGSPLRGQGGSPMSNEALDVRDGDHELYNFIEIQRNRLSGIVDRFHG